MSKAPMFSQNLWAFDATSLYPSAMADKDSEYPDATSARAFKQEEERECLRLSCNNLVQEQQL